MDGGAYYAENFTSGSFYDTLCDKWRLLLKRYLSTVTPLRVSFLHLGNCLGCYSYNNNFKGRVAECGVFYELIGVLISVKTTVILFYEY